MKIIILTNSEIQDKKVYINVDKIKFFEKSYDQQDISYVYFDVQTIISVRETPEEIIKLIENQNIYSKQDFLKAAEAGEVSMIDAKHIVNLLDEIKNKNA